MGIERTNVEEIIRDALQERFPNAAVNRVISRAGIDDDGDSILEITVVLEDSGTRLDRGRLVGFVRHLRSQLCAADHDEFPVLSFVARSEADKLKFEAA